jgi:hypothetical protein
MSLDNSTIEEKKRSSDAMKSQKKIHIPKMTFEEIQMKMKTSIIPRHSV